MKILRIGLGPNPLHLGPQFKCSAVKGRTQICKRSHIHVLTINPTRHVSANLYRIISYDRKLKRTWQENFSMSKTQKNDRFYFGARRSEVRVAYGGRASFPRTVSVENSLCSHKG